MLFEMYQRFAKQMNWKCKIVDSQMEGSGLRAGVIRVDGDEVSSYLSQETGIHRLVRISPFDKNSRRHTSFASVTVSPLITNNSTKSAIRSQDLKVDRFRSSGPGGQHVNKTESAIRLTQIRCIPCIRKRWTVCQHNRLCCSSDTYSNWYYRGMPK